MTAKKKSTGMTVHKGGSHAPVKHKRRAKGLRRRARGAGLLKGGSQGMAPTLKRFGIVGAAAVGTHVLATALTDRLFIDPANTANPSYTGTADKVDSRENMRAGVAILGGLAAGSMLRKRAPNLALGVAVGGISSGVVRLGTRYQWQDKVYNWFAPSTEQRTIATTRSAAALPMGGGARPRVVEQVRDQHGRLLTVERRTA